MHQLYRCSTSLHTISSSELAHVTDNIRGTYVVRIPTASLRPLITHFEKFVFPVSRYFSALVIISPKTCRNARQ